MSINVTPLIHDRRARQAFELKYSINVLRKFISKSRYTKQSVKLDIYFHTDFLAYKVICKWNILTTWHFYDAVSSSCVIRGLCKCVLYSNVLEFSMLTKITFRAMYLTIWELQARLFDPVGDVSTTHSIKTLKIHISSWIVFWSLQRCHCLASSRASSWAPSDFEVPLRQHCQSIPNTGYICFSS